MSTPNPISESESLAVSHVLVEAIQVRYGHLLSPEQLAQVHNRLVELLPVYQGLYSIVLTNADEPVVTFRAQSEAHHAI